MIRSNELFSLYDRVVYGKEPYIITAINRSLDGEYFHEITSDMYNKFVVDVPEYMLAYENGKKVPKLKDLLGKRLHSFQVSSGEILFYTRLELDCYFRLGYTVPDEEYDGLKERAPVIVVGEPCTLFKTEPFFQPALITLVDVDNEYCVIQTNNGSIGIAMPSMDKSLPKPMRFEFTFVAGR